MPFVLGWVYTGLYNLWQKEKKGEFPVSFLKVKKKTEEGKGGKGKRK